MHCNTFARVLMILIDYSLTRKLGYTHDTVSMIHTILLY